MRSDFSLKVGNYLTAYYLIVHRQLERLTAPDDLNTTQLATLLSKSQTGWFMITLHQHILLFSNGALHVLHALHVLRLSVRR
tara:strand:+ start:30509 stop:30754 length:246 start_codon:yes stop_codon:yes gene_type:complete